MIFIMSAAYCSSDFELEFGKIPPSFLPLGNKRLYEYQINLFKNIDDNIIIALPKSFKISKYDFQKIVSFGVKISYIPDNLSLGEALVYAINMNSPINETLYIFHGDSYFEYINFNKNSLTIAKVRENYKWAYLFDNEKLNYNIKNNIDIDNELILSGFMNIENPYILIKCIIENNYSFIEGLKQYSIFYPFEILINHSWLDFGLITNYFHSKKAISSQRCFNELKFCNDGYMIKTSNWDKKIQSEINWFLNFPKELDIYIPKFKEQSNQSYKIEYLCNNTLSELFVFGGLPPYVWENIFKSLKIFLNKLHQYQSVDVKICFNYKNKTLERLKLLNDDNFFSDLMNKKYSYNEKNPISLNDILNDINLYLLDNKKYSIIHGDFCFSNIMFDFRSGFIKVFDPRGMDFEENITIYGDMYYDYAKLVHCIFGMYDFIISGFYTCTINNNKIDFVIDMPDKIYNIQKKFTEIFYLNKNIFAITLHLFLSMLPLHHDSKERQKALFANIFRLYFLFKEEGLL
ncbi:capsular biosynthesis protein [Campylobacter volucris]|uniref:capsular biosynthesis protein n=1 Tax=Campylobacter volucris TaxID=1031542 RepID=UPI0018A0C158|nr:capsular biosynthesis protein [Campylobacter volucris]MBF7060340.1 capsular biosynthesis protein [Campylobacter volucris]